MKKEDLITTPEAAAIIGVTNDSIRNYRRRGWLHGIRRANGRVLFARDEVQKLRERLIATRYKTKGPQLVQASQDADQQDPQAWRKQSLRDDPEPIIFNPAVWKALAEYEASKRGRREA